MRPETTCAVAAVRAAGEILSRRAHAEVVLSKGELDIVTGSDLAAEDAIRTVLAACGNHPVVGEERTEDARGAGETYWLVDPLCGTQTYACRIPAFCTNVALVEADVVTASAVFDGATGDVYWAERGAGAFRMGAGEPERLSAADGAVMGMEHAAPPRSAEWTAAFGRLMGSLLLARRWHVRLLGTTLPFTRVATGEFAGLYLLAPVPSPLHTAAGCLLAEEAGALVSDTGGRPWDLTTTEFIVAATPSLHRELLALHATSFRGVIRSAGPTSSGSSPGPLAVPQE